MLGLINELFQTNEPSLESNWNQRAKTLKIVGRFFFYLIARTVNLPEFRAHISCGAVFISLGMIMGFRKWVLDSRSLPGTLEVSLECSGGFKDEAPFNYLGRNVIK